VTLTDADAFRPSAVAVMDVEPADTPVTTPDDDTLAIDGSPDVHVTGRASGLPCASRGVALSCSVFLTSMLADDGDTVMLEARIASTVMLAAADFPSTVALMVADPGATALTRPEPLTAATAELLDAHETGRESVFPCASRAVALSWTFFPTSSVAVVGEMLTVATAGALTVTADDADFPSAVAVIDADPGAIALTRPEPLTVATDASLVDQEIARVIATPFASRVTALSWAVLPTSSATEPGDTVTLATGTAATEMLLDPDLPSTDAVTTADPGATPDTSPVPLTVAIDASLVVQLTDFVSGSPLTSRTVALS
jgi:hypothetical protein